MRRELPDEPRCQQGQWAQLQDCRARARLGAALPHAHPCGFTWRGWGAGSWVLVWMGHPHPPFWEALLGAGRWRPRAEESKATGRAARACSVHPQS